MPGGHGVAYALEFLPTARKEWDALDCSVRDAFKKALAKRLEQPRAGQPLRGSPAFYTTKPRGVGYRLVYAVRDEALVVLVLAVGRRDSGIYERVSRR